MTSHEDLEIDREDRRKHLEFIQAVIGRMSTASTRAKSWLLPVVTATYGYALIQRVPSVAMLGIGAVLLFAYLDACYLNQEKRFRVLYSEVANRNPDIPTFSLNPCDAIEEPKQGWWRRIMPGVKVWGSWSISVFYGLVLIAGVVIVVGVSCFGG